MRRIVRAVGVGIALLALGSCSSAPPPTIEPAAVVPAQLEPDYSVSKVVITGGGRDRTGSHSAVDWVTNSDQVLVATVVREVKPELSQEEIQLRGGMIDRTVHLRVDRLLWSAPDSPQPAPSEVTAPAAGFLSNEGIEQKFAIEDSSRLEVGHAYVLALEWLDDPCFEDPKLGQWAGLGSGGTIPFDAGVLGVGEFEGRTIAQDEAVAVLGDGIRGQVVGKSADALIELLQTAAPGLKVGYDSECDLNDR